MTRLKAIILFTVLLTLVAVVLVLSMSCADKSVSFAPYVGTTWEIRATEIAEKLSALVWTGTEYVAVGGHKILTSPNGYSWQLRHTYNGGELNSVFWSGDQFYVVGDGVIMKSADAITWTEGQVDDNLVDIAVLDDIIVAIGESAEVYVSTDGLDWSKSVTRYGTTLISCRALMTRQETYFWAGGEDYRILYSQNGLTWGSAYYNASLAGYNLLGIANAIDGSTRWVGVGEFGYIVGVGLAENYVTSRLTTRHLRSVATNGTEWVIVGDGGTVISSLADTIGSVSIAFALRNSPTTLNLNDVVWNGGGFLAVGDSGIVLASPAGR